MKDWIRSRWFIWGIVGAIVVPVIVFLTLNYSDLSAAYPLGVFIWAIILLPCAAVLIAGTWRGLLKYISGFLGLWLLLVLGFFTYYHMDMEIQYANLPTEIFQDQAWKADAFCAGPRSRMVKDLVHSRVLIGKTEGEVKGLLGPTNYFINDGDFAYCIYDSFDDPSLFHHSLWMQFHEDGAGRVTGVYFSRRL